MTILLDDFQGVSQSDIDPDFWVTGHSYPHIFVDNNRGVFTTSLATVRSAEFSHRIHGDNATISFDLIDFSSNYQYETQKRRFYVEVYDFFTDRYFKVYFILKWDTFGNHWNAVYLEYYNGDTAYMQGYEAFNYGIHEIRIINGLVSLWGDDGAGEIVNIFSNNFILGDMILGRVFVGVYQSAVLDEDPIPTTAIIDDFSITGEFVGITDSLGFISATAEEPVCHIGNTMECTFPPPMMMEIPSERRVVVDDFTSGFIEFWDNPGGHAHSGSGLLKVWDGLPFGSVVLESEAVMWGSFSFSMDYVSAIWGGIVWRFYDINDHSNWIDVRFFYNEGGGEAKFQGRTSLDQTWISSPGITEAYTGHFDLNLGRLEWWYSIGGTDTSVHTSVGNPLSGKQFSITSYSIDDGNGSVDMVLDNFNLIVDFIEQGVKCLFEELTCVKDGSLSNCEIYFDTFDGDIVDPVMWIDPAQPPGLIPRPAEGDVEIHTPTEYLYFNRHVWPGGFITYMTVEHRALDNLDGLIINIHDESGNTVTVGMSNGITSYVFLYRTGFDDIDEWETIPCQYKKVKISVQCGEKITATFYYVDHLHGDPDTVITPFLEMDIPLNPNDRLKISYQVPSHEYVWIEEFELITHLTYIIPLFGDIAGSLKACNYFSIMTYQPPVIELTKFMLNRSQVTGNTSESLDGINPLGIDGTSVKFNVGLICWVIEDDDTISFYELKNSTGMSQSLPEIVIPVNNPGDWYWERIESAAFATVDEIAVTDLDTVPVDVGVNLSGKEIMHGMFDDNNSGLWGNATFSSKNALLNLGAASSGKSVFLAATKNRKDIF